LSTCKVRTPFSKGYFGQLRITALKVFSFPLSSLVFLRLKLKLVLVPQLVRTPSLAREQLQMLSVQISFIHLALEMKTSCSSSLRPTVLTYCKPAPKPPGAEERAVGWRRDGRKWTGEGSG